MGLWGLRHRFELNRIEIIGVVGSAAAALLVVFLLGIYAGRGLNERQLMGGDQVVTLPIAPASERPPEHDEPTIDDTVGASGALAAAPAADAGASGSGRGEAPALLGTTGPEPASAPGGAAGHDAQKATGASPPPARAAAKPLPPPAASSQVRVTAAIEKPAAAPPPARGSGSWSVQVTASRDPRTADAMLRRLRAKGYDAYVVRVRRHGEVFYRVRVGRYGSMEQAGEMVTRLRREREVPEAFVASD